jgi:hypothetical protein
LGYALIDGVTAVWSAILPQPREQPVRGLWEGQKADRSSRVMALSGLRMMPPFP